MIFIILHYFKEIRFVDNVFKEDLFSVTRANIININNSDFIKKSPIFTKIALENLWPHRIKAELKFCVVIDFLKESNFDNIFENIIVTLQFFYCSWIRQLQQLLWLYISRFPESRP